MLASAITDAKTNFFIQCSWEKLEWDSRFKHSLAEISTDSTYPVANLGAG
jgi:hypothetical protein